MPLVEHDAEVTLVTLVFRSLRWLDFVMEGVDSSKQEARYRWLVVANDATEEVRRDPRVSVDYQNTDPSEYYINRVYRAWNAGVLESPTQWCILLNTDMYCSDGAIDGLLDEKKTRGHIENNPKTLPCGLLIENGRIPSAMPEHVLDLGTNPDNFRKKDFLNKRSQVCRPGEREPGRLYQPVLFDRQEFLDLGGYPEGNIGGVSGDKILFDRYVQAGFKWVTCLGSVWYHCQEGETRWP